MDMKPLLPPVTVNGVTISPERIAAEAQNHPAPKGKPGLAWKAAARALALREILLQEARARGLTADPAELAPGQWETEDEALIRQLLDQAIAPETPDEAETSDEDSHDDERSSEEAAAASAEQDRPEAWDAETVESVDAEDLRRQDSERTVAPVEDPQDAAVDDEAAERTRPAEDDQPRKKGFLSRFFGR